VLLRLAYLSVTNAGREPERWLPSQLSYVITCIDSRTEPAAILGAGLGDTTVQRVVGGRVTPAVLRDIAYISYLTETKTPGGPWWGLAVIHHTDCGSMLLADPELRRGFAACGGYVEAELAWLPATDPPPPSAPTSAPWSLHHRYPQHQDQRLRLQHRSRHPRHHRRTHPRRPALTTPGCLPAPAHAAATPGRTVCAEPADTTGPLPCHQEKQQTVTAAWARCKPCCPILCSHAPHFTSERDWHDLNRSACKHR
jgi:Carbonic anhydrase